MRVTNEPGETGPSGAFAEMFRLQADFQARLAEETLRYLRRLQGAVVPSAPGTVVLPGEEVDLRTRAEPGGRAELILEIENLQRVHCMVTPQLTPLVSSSGVTWFPALAGANASRLVPPGTLAPLAVAVDVPAELPPGEYRGALLLQGFRSNSLPVAIQVGPEDPPPKRTAKKRAAAKKRTAGKRTAKKRSPRKGSS